MSTLLAEAIKQLQLQPGQTYRATVNGHAVEVRKLDSTPRGEPADELSPLAEMVMLEPWFELPDPPAVCVVRPKPGPIELPDPPTIPQEDETP